MEGFQEAAELGLRFTSREDLEKEKHFRQVLEMTRKPI